MCLTVYCVHFNTLQHATHPLVFCLPHRGQCVWICILLNKCSFAQLSQRVYHRRHYESSIKNIPSMQSNTYQYTQHWQKFWAGSVANIKKNTKMLCFNWWELGWYWCLKGNMPQKTFVPGGSQMWGIQPLCSQGNNNSKTTAIQN